MHPHFLNAPSELPINGTPTSPTRKGVACGLPCLALTLLSFSFDYIYSSLSLPIFCVFVLLLPITNISCQKVQHQDPFKQITPTPTPNYYHHHHQHACLRVLLPVWRHDCHQHHLHRLRPQAVQQLPPVLNALTLQRSLEDAYSPSLFYFNSPMIRGCNSTRWESGYLHSHETRPERRHTSFVFLSLHNDHFFRLD